MMWQLICYEMKNENDKNKDQPGSCCIMLLNTFPIVGPNNARITMTTMATMIIIMAYSTSP
jgi:hypothetical protein